MWTQGNVDRFEIVGGKPLYGKPKISAAKNAALPVIAASVAYGGKTRIVDCPRISDVCIMADIIDELGGTAVFDENGLTIDASKISNYELPIALTSQIRASLFFVGGLLSRFGSATIAKSGGCNIGDRPMDIHVEAFRALGVDVEEGQVVKFRKKRTSGGRVKLRFPSVGATESLMAFAAGLSGVTVIDNAAREPEIRDVARYLRLLGVSVTGDGSTKIEIRGGINVEGDKTVILSKDRIEAGTFLFAGAICGGEMDFEREDLENLQIPLRILSNNACKIYPKNDKIIRVEFFERGRGFGKVVTAPYPEFPTDLQPQLTAAACFVDGVTAVEETVFPDRFNFANELTKAGADVIVRRGLCVVNGGRKLSPSTFVSEDLRGGAALTLTALGISGRSEVVGVRHIDRGYLGFETKLRALGADIRRKTL